MLIISDQNIARFLVIIFLNKRGQYTYLISTGDIVYQEISWMSWFYLFRFRFVNVRKNPEGIMSFALLSP